MSYRPKQLSRELPANVVALATLGQQGRIAIYAGAGLSLSQPTGLPSGKALARSIHRQLLRSFPILSGCSDEDLLAIADAVASEPGGESAIRFTACASAEFTTARPGFAHRMLAYLMLDGLVDVLTTNWDDCIERGPVPERVSGVVNQSDLLNMVGPSVLKVHGCATQPITILITTKHLDHPPKWVEDEVRARLGNSVVVFVGIGSIAGYVEKRLQDAVEAVGDVANIRVVSPDVGVSWATTKWAEVMKTLSPEHRIAQEAEEFLDDLATAHLRAGLAGIATIFASDAEMLGCIQQAVLALETHDAEVVLGWLRGCAVVPQKGEAVLRTHPLPNALAALGVLGGDSFRIGHDGLISAGDATYCLLVATAHAPWARVWREASIRLESILSRGCSPDSAPTFLLAGGQGSRPVADPLPHNVLGTGDRYDVIGGPTEAVPKCLVVDDVLAA